MGTFYLYLGAVSRYWWAFMMAGPFIVDETIKWLWPSGRDWLANKLTPIKRRRLEIILMLAGVFFAGYLAWQDEHQARLIAEDKIAKTATAPAPAQTQRDPDGLYQLGRLVGRVSAATENRAVGQVQFGQITVQQSFNANAPFDYRDLQLRIVKAGNSAGGGVPGSMVFNIFDVVAEIVGPR